MVFSMILGAAAMVFVVYPKVKASNQASAEMQNITTMQAGIQSLFQTKKNYAGLTTAVAVDAKIAPENMINPADKTLSSAFLGTITVGTSNADLSYTITYASVPTEVCLKMATGLAKNFDMVLINNAAIKANKAFDFDMSVVTAQCNSTTTNTIVMTGS